MSAVRTKQHNVRHTRKMEDGKVIKAGRGNERVNEGGVVPSLRSGAVTQFKTDKPKKKGPSLYKDAMRAMGSGAVKGFVTATSLSMAFGTLGFAAGGAAGGSAMLAMVIPFAWPIVGIAVLYALADAGDKYIQKAFLTKKDNQTLEQAEETVQEWEDIEKEAKTNPELKKFQPSLRNRIGDTLKSVWRGANSWAYFVGGDLMGVPKAKLLANTAKYERENARRDKITNKVRRLEHQLDQALRENKGSKRCEAIRSRIRFEQSKI